MSRDISELINALEPLVRPIPTVAHTASLHFSACRASAGPAPPVTSVPASPYQQRPQGIQNVSVFVSPDPQDIMKSGPVIFPRYRISLCRSSVTKDTLARVGRSAMDA